MLATGTRDSPWPIEMILYYFDPICVVPPKVAKASTIVTVECRCHWHSHPKNIANGNMAKDIT